jgi:transposase
MLGIKIRDFQPITAVTLDDLVPHDHFYRHLERVLDLSFVRDLVADCYASGGRPSIDPVVFFKLQLVLFFAGVRSERQSLAVAADRLSVRWYLGYDLDELLPDHSSLTRIRDRYGIDIFRRFIDIIVEQCQRAGLVWDQELYLDATIVEANASLDSLMPRFAIEAHLDAVFAASNPPDDSDAVAALAARVTPLPIPEEGDRNGTPERDWLVRNGRPVRRIVRGHYQLRSDYEASHTDPDASLLYRPQTGLRLAYHDHDVVDGGRDQHRQDDAGHAGRGHGESAGPRPALAQLLPLAPLATAGDG